MVRFNMVKITTKQFAIVSEPKGEQSSIGFEWGFNVNYSMGMHRIGITPTLTLLDEQNQKLLILSLFCEFEIHPDDWQAMITGKKLIVPKNLIEYFISQTVGTMRGVLYCKTEDTPYSFFVLPSVNVAEIVQTDAEFVIEE